MHVFINGQFVDRDAARVSAFDAGFQHGVGLFETMLARNGSMFRPADHVDRLVASARELRLSENLKAGPLIDAVQLTLERNELDRARVRITVTGGDLNLLQSRGETAHDPTIVIVAQPPTAYPDDFFTQGITVLIADGRDNPLDPMAGHKTLDYWRRISALQVAAGRGAGEALWFSVSNHLAGGSVSNAFLVHEGKLLTPYARGEEEEGALAAPVRRGVTRAAIIELAAERGIETERRQLTIEDVLGADELFLTNSSWGVLPVVGLEREQIGDGAVGELTSDLRQDWERLIDEETRAG